MKWLYAAGVFALAGIAVTGIPAIAQTASQFGSASLGGTGSLTEGYWPSDPLAPAAQEPDTLFGPQVNRNLDLLSSAIAGSPFSSPVSGQISRFDSVALSPDFHLQFGEAGEEQAPPGLPLSSSVNQLQLSPIASQGGNRAAMVGADWKIAPWIGLDVAAARGGFDIGTPLRYNLPDTSTMLGVTAYVNFGDGWVTSVTFDDGRTQTDLTPTGLALGSEEKDAHAIDLGVSRSDLLGSESLDVSLIRPMQLNNSLLLGPQISLSSATPETDLQLNYETTFDSNITLEANAGYQMNVGGQPGTKAMSILSRAKINF
jgi:hypothetical protein